MPSGVDFQLTLRGQEPVEIGLRGIDGAPGSDLTLDTFRARMPEWVTLQNLCYRMARQRI